MTVTAWTDDAATVREALGTASSWTTREDVRYEERDKGIAALARLTALLETQEQRHVERMAPLIEAAADMERERDAAEAALAAALDREAGTSDALDDLRSAHDTETTRLRDENTSLLRTVNVAVRQSEAAEDETTRLREMLERIVGEYERTGEITDSATEDGDMMEEARALLAGEPQT